MSCSRLGLVLLILVQQFRTYPSCCAICHSRVRPGRVTNQTPDQRSSTIDRRTKCRVCLSMFCSIIAGDGVTEGKITALGMAAPFDRRVEIVAIGPAPDLRSIPLDRGIDAHSAWLGCRTRGNFRAHSPAATFAAPAWRYGRRTHGSSGHKRQTIARTVLSAREPPRSFVDRHRRFTNVR